MVDFGQDASQNQALMMCSKEMFHDGESDYNNDSNIERQFFLLTN